MIEHDKKGDTNHDFKNEHDSAGGTPRRAPLAKKRQDNPKKGFYTALYACVGVMLLVAVVLSYQAISISNDVTKGQTAENDPLASVNNSNDTPLGSMKQPSPTPTVSTPSPSPTASRATATPTPRQDTSRQPTVTPTPTVTIIPADDSTSSLNDEPILQIRETEIIPAASIKNDNESAELGNFDSFDETVSKMTWPVVGNILMDFSTDKLVYDKTLEQYRTNDNLCIASSEGTQVRSAADGVVSQIYYSQETGNTLVIDHGNGWATTYSQLQDTILVKVGDVVDSGQIVGGVSTPSIYSVLLGNHLAFAVTKDNTPVNPNTVLE